MIRIKKAKTTFLIGCLSLAILSGCGGWDPAETAQETTQETTQETAQKTAQETVQETEILTSAEMFTERDLSGEYEESNAVEILLSQGDVTITEEGVYHISGSLTDGMICVDADKTAKVQLVLDGVRISNSANAAIYVKEADKVFITLAEDSDNSLSSGGYSELDGNNIDGVIFSKSDLVINGSGNLTVDAAQGHAVVSKDDLKITGGQITITAQKKGLSGKDSVRVAGGTIQITAGTDGIHAGGDDIDADKGYVYIAGGEIYIAAGDDGIHGDGDARIAGGNIEITTSYEGIEGCNVEISGGNIRLSATDDGVNAAGDGTNHVIRITGGVTYVHARGDGLDSNGSLEVSGGEVYVSGSENGANSALDYETTGQITGGVVVAVGNRGMAMNFGSSSTQGSIMVTTSEHGAGTLVTLQDSEGQELLSYTSEGSFSSVVVSCPQLTIGGVYTVTAGEESQTVELSDGLIWGTGNGNGGFGGRMQGGGRRDTTGGGFQNGGRSDMPEGNLRGGKSRDMSEGGFQNEELPDMSEGGFQNEERPDMPEGGFQNGELPDMSEGGFQNGGRPDMSEGGFQNGGRPDMSAGGFPGGEQPPMSY